MSHAGSSSSAAPPVARVRPLSELPSLRMGVTGALEREAAAEPSCTTLAPEPFTPAIFTRACACEGCAAVNAVPSAQAQAKALIRRDPLLMASRLIGMRKFREDAATLNLLFAVLDSDDVHLMGYNGSLCCSPACPSAITLQEGGGTFWTG